MRHLLLAGFLLSTLAFAQQPSATHPTFPTGNTTPLGSKIALLLADPSVSRAHWGIAVTALDGTPIYGYDEGKLFRPASNAKIFTTAAAMAMLGPVATTTTTAWFQEPSTDGASGNGLHVHSVGLAYLSAISTSATLADAAPVDPLQSIAELAEKIARSGIKTITGDVIWKDDQWFDRFPEGWSIEDMSWGYGAPVSSIVINDNQLKLTITPHRNGGPRAALSPDVGDNEVGGHLAVSQSSESPEIAVERKPGFNQIQIFGHIKQPTPSPLLGHGWEEIPYVTQIAIPDPAEFAAQALKFKLSQLGIPISGTARAEHSGSPTLNFSSQMREPIRFPTPAPAMAPSLIKAGPGCAQCPGRSVGQPQNIFVEEISTTSRDADITFTLKQSQNLHAEFILRRLGAQSGQSGSTAQGARVVRQWLINTGLDGDDFLFYDGSGLSAKDLVAPRATTQVLSYATTQPWFAQWKSALPIGGVDGTLASRFTEPSLKGHVFAKTGTLGESRALSGYVDCASGRQVIFSIMVDNHMPTGSPDRAVMDKIVAAIAAAE